MYPPKFNIKIHIFYKQLLLNLICTVFSCSTGVLNAAALCRSLSMINPTAGCLLLTDLLKMFEYMSPKYYSITDLNCHFSVTGTQVPHFFNDLYANSDLNLLKKYTSQSSSQLRQFQLLLIPALNVLLLICLVACFRSL